MIPSIRPITEDEKPQAEALYRNAYKITTELSQRWTRLADLSTTRAIVDNGRVSSILIIKPFEVWIGGLLMKMGGISGVATWADQQGKGYAGHLVRRAISDMRDAGQSVSILYPFLFQFYGGYGYELANDYTVYECTQADFAPSAADPHVTIRAADLDRDMEAIKACYLATAPRWNTMVNRDEDRWHHWKEYFHADLRQIYLIERLADKQVVGHFGIIDTALADGGFEATVTGLVFQDGSHYALLSRFLHRLPTSVKKIKLISDSSHRLWYLFKEPRVMTQVHPGYQVRVVDVEKACMERGYRPSTNAEVRFTVQDNCASWNEQPWRLTVREGRPEMVREAKDTGILSLSIQHFSAIFVGYRRATDFVHDYPEHMQQLQALDEIFHDRHTRLLDFF